MALCAYLRPSSHASCRKIPIARKLASAGQAGSLPCPAPSMITTPVAPPWRTAELSSGLTQNDGATKFVATVIQGLTGAFLAQFPGDYS